MLIANMVGRNEENRFLQEVLDHLNEIVDTIVYTDDCSDDNTLDIVKAAGAEVYTTGESEPLFTRNEGKLRNMSWHNLSQHARIGDWILAIDCDEKLYSTSPNTSIDDLLNQEMYDVINISFYHMWNETQYRVDKLWAPTPSSRLFRFYYGGKFADRELACGSEPTYVQTLMRRGKYMIDSGLVMQHLGYVRDEDKLAKYERYMAIDAGNFHAGSHIASIIDPEPTLVDWKN